MSFYLGVFLFVVALALALPEGGHGNWVPMRLLFPWVAVIERILPMARGSSLIGLLFPIHFLQFPIYIFGLDLFAKAGARWGAFVVGLAHTVAAGLAFVSGG